MNYLLKSESALYYECGYSCDNALLLILGKERFFITDGRYTLDAREQVQGAEVIESANLYATLATIIRKNRVSVVYFDPYEITVKELDELTSKLHKVNFIVHENYSQLQRIIKTEEEIALIAESVRLNAQAFENFGVFLQNEGIGQSEHRLHFEAKRILSDYGRYDLSFDPIVAMEKNAAKPHALPSEETLEKGDVLLFDAGIKYKRYCSDRTRTFEIGDRISVEKSQNITKAGRQKIYDTVLKAQEEAIKSVKEGMKAREIDKVAREVIDKAGYGSYFNHSLGHGVGLDIHELPRLSQRSRDFVTDGMVFTIEPGIYIPGDFGVRIEDVVVMKNGRAEIL